MALLLTTALLALLLLPLPASAQEPAPAVPRPDTAGLRAVAGLADRGVDRPELARRLRQLLSDPAFARAHVGLVVQVAETGEVLFSRNGAKRFVPASTAKLVPAAVALEELGAGFRWTTRLQAGGPVRDGRLEGDLRIVGDGDPTVEAGTLAAWADTLRTAGIDTVAGDVVGDDRAFPPPRWGRGWMWDDLHLGWAGGVTALRMADPGIRAWLLPGPRLGDDARVRLADTAAALPLRVRVRTGAPGSDLRLRLLPGDGLLPGTATGGPALEGWIPADVDSVALELAPAHPTDQLLDRLRAAFREAGIEVEGRFRRARGPTGGNGRGAGARADGRRAADRPGPADAGRWSAAVRSDSLGAVVADILKPSDNLGAESLLRTLGREEGRAGTDDEGLAVVRGTLADWGIDPEAAVLADGSGLSRYDALTPTALVRLLRAMWRSPEHHELFRSALPSPVGSGTLEGRFPGTPVREGVRAKTGSLSSVRGLAGYVEDGDGETLIFALLMNGYHVRGDAASALRDLLVEQLGLYHRAVRPGWPSVRAPADTAGGGR